VGLLGSQSKQQALDFLTTINDALVWRGIAPKLIVAGYADFRQAGTLEPNLLPEVAARAHAAGCMLDTLKKDGACLFDFLDSQSLKEFIGACRRSRLLCALAGSLQSRHAGLLKELQPDVVGVRGAVCHRGLRTETIDRPKVAEFRLNLVESKVWLPTA
jgi:hypothetical protein